ncbi:hypothetical protein OROGR_007076 [Orobanche gracilis]
MPGLHPPGNKKLLRVLRVDGLEMKTASRDLTDYKGNLNRGALHFAAEAGLTDACKYSVEGLKLDVNAKDTVEGADANFVANGFYPPHLAANGGNVEIINLLVEAPHIMNDVLFTHDMVYPPQ